MIKQTLIILWLFSSLSTCAVTLPVKPLPYQDNRIEYGKAGFSIVSAKPGSVATLQADQEGRLSLPGPLFFTVTINNNSRQTIEADPSGIKITADGRSVKPLSQAEHSALVREWQRSETARAKKREARMIFGAQSGVGAFESGTFPDDEYNPIELQMNIESIQSQTKKRLAAVELLASDALRVSHAISSLPVKIEPGQSSVILISADPSAFPEKSGELSISLHTGSDNHLFLLGF